MAKAKTTKAQAAPVKKTMAKKIAVKGKKK